MGSPSIGVTRLEERDRLKGLGDPADLTNRLPSGREADRSCESGVEWLALDFGQRWRERVKDDWNQGSGNRRSNRRNIYDPNHSGISGMIRQSNNREWQQGAQGRAFANNESTEFHLLPLVRQSDLAGLRKHRDLAGLRKHREKVCFRIGNCGRAWLCRP
jgi:hypothetical protein